jgi:hypothetical protein
VTAREELEVEVARRAPEFDPVALLDLLAHMGYRPEEVLFESNHTATSAANAIQSVEFRSTPIRHVVVTVNTGLLGTQGVLPSYFKQLLASGSTIDDVAFLEFLHFFDHRLVEGWVKSVYPERDYAIFADWDKTKKSYLNLIGLRSVSALHWLFQLVFPELGVRVERGALTRNVKLDGTRLNYSVLGGDSVLGGWTKVPVPGFVATLFSDDEQTEHGHPWVEEVRRRLDSIVFRAIEDAAMDLRVSLVIRSEKVWAMLKPTSYLGFDRIRGGTRRNREVLVWNGQVTAGTLCKKRSREPAGQAERGAAVGAERGA